MQQPASLIPAPSLALTPSLAEASRLSVVQAKEWAEIITGWETRNRYEVRNEGGEIMCYAGEVDGDWARRWFLGSMRPFEIEFRSESGELMLTLSRKWRWWFHYAEIRDGEGTLLGSIQRRFSVVRRKYDICDADGVVIATLFGPLFKPWTFYIKCGDTESGAIRKKWSGLFKEAFSTADSFGIEMAPDLPAEHKPLMLGATLLIDFVHFEDRQGLSFTSFFW